MPEVVFEGTQSILRVADLGAAVAFYVDKLGFTNASWALADFTSVSRGRASIFLCQGGQGRGGAWVWIGVDDADELHRQYVAAGVNVILPPTRYAWALEFHVEDLDGNVLRFGSD